MKSVNIYFKAIQGQYTLLKNQNDWICILANELKQMALITNVQSSIDMVAVSVIDDFLYMSNGYVLSKHLN